MNYFHEHKKQAVVFIGGHYLVKLIEGYSLFLVALYIDYSYHLEYDYDKAGDNYYKHYAEGGGRKIQH